MGSGSGERGARESTEELWYERVLRLQKLYCFACGSQLSVRAGNIVKYKAIQSRFRAHSGTADSLLDSVSKIL